MHHKIDIKALAETHVHNTTQFEKVGGGYTLYLHWSLI